MLKRGTAPAIRPRAGPSRRCRTHPRQACCRSWNCWSPTVAPWARRSAMSCPSSSSSCQVEPYEHSRWLNLTSSATQVLAGALVQNSKPTIPPNCLNKLGMCNNLYSILSQLVSCQLKINSDISSNNSKQHSTLVQNCIQLLPARKRNCLNKFRMCRTCIPFYRSWRTISSCKLTAMSPVSAVRFFYFFCGATSVRFRVLASSY
jgi:hypothetical protein